VKRQTMIQLLDLQAAAEAVFDELRAIGLELPDELHPQYIHAVWDLWKMTDLEFENLMDEWDRSRDSESPAKDYIERVLKPFQSQRTASRNGRGSPLVLHEDGGRAHDRDTPSNQENAIDDQ
jgi:hypothetical protein